MIIALIEMVEGIVTVNDSNAEVGRLLHYTDTVDASKGVCIIKFTKSGRLYDITSKICNIGSAAIINEKSIPIYGG